jgi:hypothetical protein
MRREFQSLSSPLQYSGGGRSHFCRFIASGTLLIIVFTQNIACAQPLSITQAEQILESANAIPYAAAQIAGCVDPKKRDALLIAYNQQLEAIAVLGTAKDPRGAKILIPYLNYADNAVDLVVPPGPRKKEDLDATRKAYPAFSALLSLPSSSFVVEDYCLNTKNPTDYRISAFLVLRYLDSDRFQKVSMRFDKEFKSSNQQVKTYLSAIEDGSARFWGVVPITTQQ